MTTKEEFIEATFQKGAEADDAPIVVKNLLKRPKNGMYLCLPTSPKRNQRFARYLIVCFSPRSDGKNLSASRLNN